MVSRWGGIGIAVQVDHTDEDQVRQLVERLRSDHGRVDLLVNDVWGGDELSEWDKPFWEHSLQNGLLMQQRAVFSHIITSHHVAPLMVARRQGLIIEITDGVGSEYRGSFFYDLAKASVIRLAYAMSEELRPHNVTALALTPGFLRSEAVLDHFGVTSENWRDAVAQDPHFAFSETPYYVGRAVAALAADPDVSKKSGRALSSWKLAEEYGFTDIDGSQPNWGRHWEEFQRAETFRR